MLWEDHVNQIHSSLSNEVSFASAVCCLLHLRFMETFLYEVVDFISGGRTILIQKGIFQDFIPFCLDYKMGYSHSPDMKANMQW